MGLFDFNLASAFNRLLGRGGDRAPWVDQEAIKLDEFQAQGKSGKTTFELGDKPASTPDTKYGTLGQVPPDVMMARWSQHTGKPMGSGAGSSYAQRGRDLQSMAKQYKNLTTKVSTLNPWSDGGVGPLFAGGGAGGGFLGNALGFLGQSMSDKWMSKTGNKMKANRDKFFSQSW